MIYLITYTLNIKINFIYPKLQVNIISLIEIFFLSILALNTQFYFKNFLILRISSFILI